MDTLVNHVRPNAAAMLQHLKILFGQAVSGRIEIAWRNSDGKGFRGKTFDVGDLDEAAEWAAHVNQTPGQNVYVGAALRKNSVPENGRCGDDDFLAGVALYVDCDDPGVYDSALEFCENHGITPPLVIVTGVNPHPRAQLWWPLETRCENPQAYREVLKSIAEHLGGDTSVHNPSRIMRIGGSISWPVKQGRIQEQTALHLQPEYNRNFDLSEFRELFQMSPATVKEGSPPSLGSADERPTSSFAIAGGPYPGPLNLYNVEGVSIPEVTSQITKGHNWHNNMIRLVAHWIRRGWSDYEIQMAAQCLTLPGYTSQQTINEVQVAINGARSKWSIPNLTHELEASVIQQGLKAQPVEVFQSSELAPRRWIFGHMALGGNVTVLVAPPGVGKSTLTIEMCVAVAMGSNDLLGIPVHDQGPTWIYNNEDDATELKRRLSAISEFCGIPIEQIAGRIFMNSGEDRPLLIASKNQSGALEPRDVEAIKTEIMDNGIKMIVVDPFLETHEASENSNEEINRVARYYREIAHETGCAVVLVHHTNKPMGSSSEGRYGDMNSARGASSLMGVARVAMTLYDMGLSDAKELGIPDEDRYRYVRLDNAKANLSLVSNTATWLEKCSIVIGNGDAVGILRPWRPPASNASPTNEQVRQILSEAKKCWEEERPFSVSSNSNRWIGSYMIETFQIPRSKAKGFINAWLANNVIRSDPLPWDKRNKTKGIKVLTLEVGVEVRNG